MKIPATLVLLGEPIEIDVSGENYTFAKGRFYLACAVSGRELWVIPKPTKKRIADSVPEKAARLFEKFSGWEPDSAYRFDAFTTARGTKIGEILSIAYRSNKWNGRTVGYIHHFENTTMGTVDDKDRPSIWKIHGTNLSVKAVGITG